MQQHLKELSMRMIIIFLALLALYSHGYSSSMDRRFNLELNDIFDRTVDQLMSKGLMMELIGDYQLEVHAPSPYQSICQASLF